MMTTRRREHNTRHFSGIKTDTSRSTVRRINVHDDICANKKVPIQIHSFFAVAEKHLNFEDHAYEAHCFLFSFFDHQAVSHRQ
jgi:hypothetical protein